MWEVHTMTVEEYKNTRIQEYKNTNSLLTMIVKWQYIKY